MRRLRALWCRESGQTMAILALAMVVLLATVGLVVDAGNAYANQRKVRNAVDAAALAATRELARNQLTTNSQVLAAARRYAQLNTVDPARVQVWYADSDGKRLQPVNDDGFSPPTEIDGVEVAGVLVEASKTVDAYLAHLVGVYNFTAVQDAMGWVTCGACTAGANRGLFPAAIDAASFDAEGLYLNHDLYFWGDKTGPGNFGWLSWNTDPGHTSNSTLVDNLNRTNRADNAQEWAVGGNIPCGPGVMASSGVDSAIDALIAAGEPVTIPVYDTTAGNGESLTYHIVGFVQVHLVGYNFSGGDKYLIARPLEGTDPTSETGCADFGVCTVKLRPPLTAVRSIAGVVSLWEPSIGETSGTSGAHKPVDVVNVLDLSSGMVDLWHAGSESKLETAKRVLTDFNGYLLPAQGDRVGLVTFPRMQNGQRYSFVCTAGTTRSRYLAQERHGLTDDIARVNSTIQSLTASGATPLAGALQQARSTVLPGGAADPGRVPVLIIASDGIANCTIDGKYTGQSGNVLGGCNAMAEQHVVEQAIQAKDEGIVIFTIAIGDDFNSALLQSVATADSDPNKPHFFQAVTADDLERIYEMIADRITEISSECSINEAETTGNGAVVTIYRDGSPDVYAQVTTSASGAFVFTDVEPGEYTFSVSLSRNGLNFNTLTEVIGGPAAEDPITLTVGDGKATYVRDLYLRTSTPLVCR